MRRLWLSLLGFALVTLLLIGMAAALTGTATGTRWLLRQVAANIPGDLQLEQVDGTLLNTLRIGRLRYVHPSIDVEADGAELTWRPGGLLNNLIDIETLRATSLHITPHATEKPEDTTVTLPDIRLPVPVRIGSVNLLDIRLITAGREIVIEELALGARAGQDGLTLSGFNIVTPQGHGSLEGTLNPQGKYPLDISYDWSGEITPGYPLAGQGRVHGSLAELTVEQTLNAPFSVEFNALIEGLPDGAPMIDATLAWRDLQWPLRGEPQYQSAQGELQLHGGLNDYTLTAEAALQGADVPSGTWRLNAGGDMNGLDDVRLAGETVAGNLQAQGDLRWRPSLHWQGTLSGDGLNPGYRLPGWSGSLALQCDTRVDIDTDSGADIAVNIEQLDGKLNGRPVSAAGGISYIGHRLTIDGLSMHSGDARLTASGGLGDDLQLDWTLLAPDLGAVWPDARGTVSAHGSVNGTRKRPVIVAHLEGDGIGRGQDSLAQLQGDLSIDLTDAQPSRITLHANGLHIAGRELNSLQVTGNGTTAAHRIDAMLNYPGGEFIAHLKGDWNGSRWRADLHDSLLSDEVIGQWPQSANSLIVIGEASSLSRTCWTQAQSALCVDASQVKEKPTAFNAKLTAVPLARLAAWLPEGVQIQGDLSGEVRASLDSSKPGQAPRAEAELTLTPGTLSYQRDETETLTAHYRDGGVTARLADGRLHAEGGLTLIDQGQMKFSLDAAPIGAGHALDASALDGRLSAQLNEIGVLAAFLPVADETRGRLDADFRLAGSLAQPRIAGELRLADASARIPQLGITLTGISLTIGGSDPARLTVNGSARSGGGDLKIDGALALEPEQGWPLALSLTGRNFELVNIPQAHVFIDPDLQLEMRRREINLTGEVTVPRADIVIRELPQSAVAVSNDVKIVGGDQSRNPWNIHSRLRLKLGDKVHFQGFNLDARLGGELTVIETPGKATTGRGEINIAEGVYKAYGRKLNIDQGRLVFNGPIDSPRLDARAVRVVGDITAGIRATGPLRTPEVSVYSSPPMDQSDALSYMLIGRPLNQASGAEGAMLTQAAASLGMSGGEFLARRIGERLGLEDVAIESGDTTEDASLVIGKFLSPRLYVGYGIGLFSSENMFRLRYELSRHLSLQAESGVQSGADLIYSFEYE